MEYLKTFRRTHYRQNIIKLIDNNTIINSNFTRWLNCGLLLGKGV